MKSTLLLLSLACALGQGDGGECVLAPQLITGAELIYSGTCTEESLVKEAPYKRVYRLENHLFVLAAGVKSNEVAFMTSLSVQDPAGDASFRPVSVKLDLANVDAQGRVKTAGNFNGPVGGLPLFEVGCFLEAPATRVGKNSVWDVEEDGRPPRSWVVLGFEMCEGSLCAKLLGRQQSEDWERPRADKKAWRRQEFVWVFLRTGVAVKVERTLEQREPARREPSHRTVTEYTIASSFILNRPSDFEARKRDILQAKRFGDDAGHLFRQPTQNSAQLDALLRKVSLYLDNSPSETQYRKAVVYLAQRIDSARKGELLLADYRAEEPMTPIGPLRIGQKVPDTVLTDLSARKSLRLQRLLGRPVLAFYYNPHTPIGVDVLTYAKGLAEKLGDRVAFMPMAVTNEPEFAYQQHATMKLPFAIFDGSALRVAFGVEATPHFIVLDREGYVRASSTGWAPHVGNELLDEILRAGAPLVDAP